MLKTEVRLDAGRPARGPAATLQRSLGAFPALIAFRSTAGTFRFTQAALGGWQVTGILPFRADGAVDVRLTDPKSHYGIAVDGLSPAIKTGQIYLYGAMRPLGTESLGIGPLIAGSR
ncbi:MAG TPA: hypothetical protein VGY31_15650 [Terriglobia bacterium]|nr:hypothetical protein [Terriglobia bacterium]